MQPSPSLIYLEQHAPHFARTALFNIVREYPNKLDHVLDGPADAQTPRQLHPVFYGSYDWHSAVHMHWLLVRLLRLFPSLPQARQIREVLNRHFADDRVLGEIDYATKASSQSFERTYGWAWLLKLQTELHRLAITDDNAKSWRSALEPLANWFAQRYLEFLPLEEYPIRAGTHGNSAFSMLLALDYAEAVQHIALRKLICQKANTWYGRDRRYPAAYEPGGDDFLSGGLVEAALMLRVIDACSYTDWWQVFCPAPQDLQIWLTPVGVTNRSDPKLAHLDGLNLSRAWCWRSIGKALPSSLRGTVDTAISAHLARSLPYAVQGNYAGTHWLASFALLALSEGAIVSAGK